MFRDIVEFFMLSLRCEFSGGGGPGPAAKPQAAPPAAAAIRPPEQTDSVAKVINPEQRRRAAPQTRSSRIFGSGFQVNTQPVSNMGAAKSRLGSGI